ncbi:hypothetical protein Tco_0530781 [Tanacetum coccineum]
MLGSDALLPEVLGCDEYSATGVKTEILRILVGQVTTLAAMADGHIEAVEVGEDNMLGMVEHSATGIKTEFLRILAGQVTTLAAMADLSLPCLSEALNQFCQQRNSTLESVKHDDPNFFVNPSSASLFIVAFKKITSLWTQSSDPVSASSKDLCGFLSVWSGVDKHIELSNVAESPIIRGALGKDRVSVQLCFGCFVWKVKEISNYFSLEVTHWQAEALQALLETFIAQEHIEVNRLWLRDNPWRAQYRSIMKRKRVYVKLAETPKVEDIGGVRSDKEVVDLIDADIEDGNTVNILNCIVNRRVKRIDGPWLPFVSENGFGK